ncbi:aspartate kinase [Streptomyces vilmorinianum]|uniref:aspartate kinase n=1 Tax=Streptomyces vilmorinianum TaxID=3051092 RepID=UPI0010FAE33A|nr:aspartate kinase [Streptomyces vilmorinianum]
MAAHDRGPAGDVVVQKYGGSSLATDDHVRHVARRIAAAVREGRRVVTVVSAQGDTTDDLIRQATAFHARPPARELDQLLSTGETASSALLAMALQDMGVAATALAGGPGGVLATGPHGSGVIVAVDTDRMVRLLDAGQTVILAGFQGLTADGDTITLGRGGSDTTAVAVAAELGARVCEIYTDVDGILTADPRVVPGARLMPTVDIDVMAEMAFAGARVMHARAVELAALYGVDIHVGHAAGSAIGTRITNGDGVDMLEAKAAVTAVVHDPEVARVTLNTTDSGEDPATAAFRLLAGQAIPTDMTSVSQGADGGLAIALTVHRSHSAAVVRSFGELALSPRDQVAVDDRVAKVSIIGKGLLSRPEYAARMLSSLTGSGIAAGSLSASQLRVSVTVPGHEAARAVSLLHSEFDLGTENGHEPLSFARQT